MHWTSVSYETPQDD